MYRYKIIHGKENHELFTEIIQPAMNHVPKESLLNKISFRIFFITELHFCTLSVTRRLEKMLHCSSILTPTNDNVGLAFAHSLVTLFLHSFVHTVLLGTINICSIHSTAHSSTVPVSEEKLQPTLYTSRSSA